MPGQPAAWWRFDEGGGDQTGESVSGMVAEIAGHKSVWKRGVSGAALQFDGYHSEVRLPAAAGPSPSSALTLEAWVAIGAYPWNWAPFVQQLDDKPEQLAALRGDPAVRVREDDHEEIDQRSIDSNAVDRAEHKDAQERLDAAKEAADQVEEDGDDRESLLQFAGDYAYQVDVEAGADLLRSDFTIIAQVRSEEGGTIVSRAPAEGLWAEHGRTLCLTEGRLVFDVGWVGAVESESNVCDGDWRHVAATYEQETGAVRLYVDGELDAAGRLEAEEGVADHVFRLGFTSPDFPDGKSGLIGDLQNVAVYDRVLSSDEIVRMSDDDSFDAAPRAGLQGFWTNVVDDGEVVADDSGNRRVAAVSEVEEIEVDFEDDDAEEEFEFVIDAEDDVGYFLGVDGLGRPGFKLR
ncbi:MAG: LamG-like jellyroll fold domain-containing protein, partial [Planctomycetota bacterium]